MLFFTNSSSMFPGTVASKGPNAFLPCPVNRHTPFKSIVCMSVLLL